MASGRHWGDSETETLKIGMLLGRTAKRRADSLEARWDHDPFFRAALERAYDAHIEDCAVEPLVFEAPAGCPPGEAVAEFARQVTVEEQKWRTDLDPFRGVTPEKLDLVLGYCDAPAAVRRRAVKRLLALRAAAADRVRRVEEEIAARAAGVLPRLLGTTAR